MYLHIKSSLILLITLMSLLMVPIGVSAKLTADNVLVLYKKSDSQSKKIAEYYSEKRHVPRSQLIAVDISGNPKKISRAKFSEIRDQIAKHLNKNIKILLLTWHAPYRVDCMSITSAFSLGFDEKYCSGKSTLFKSCHTTAISPYFNASTDTLWQRKNLRLSIMLSGQSFEDAKQLIDRGIAADNSEPEGEAYFVRTKDSARSTRWSSFKRLVEFWPKQKGISLHYIDERQNSMSTVIKNQKNIMFYMTGSAKVTDIDTNSYLPGAIADHLTSYGGAGIDNSGQMSVYRWLEAGVTGSYGAVVEPCNYTEKFPDAQVLVPSYLSGDTLIEAYWKSVQQPGQGIFVGEPLACPWCDD